MEYKWKNNKSFAFTIVDDTDGATARNIKQVYDCLYENGMLTTKTVWAYSPRDYFPGESLENEEYRRYVSELYKKGFEIAFHGAGSGGFSGDETKAALEIFKDTFGEYPRMHINHGDNPSNIYWCGKRFSAPVAGIYDFYKKKKGTYVQSEGDMPGHLPFWGDECKKHIKYIRNRVYSELNLLKCDKHTPYREKSKEPYSNYWFSSSDGMTADSFVKLLSEKNVERLERERGCAIVYTHFGYGFADENGKIRDDVKKAIENVAKHNGWFAPASEILDFMLESGKDDGYLPPAASFCLDLKWLSQKMFK